MQSLANRGADGTIGAVMNPDLAVRGNTIEKAIRIQGALNTAEKYENDPRIAIPTRRNTIPDRRFPPRINIPPRMSGGSARQLDTTSERNDCRRKTPHPLQRYRPPIMTSFLNLVSGIPQFGH